MGMAKETEYKGIPLLALMGNSEDGFPFKFGLRKAKLIIEHVAEIQKFVKNHKKED